MANLKRGHQSPMEQVIRIMVLAMEEMRVWEKYVLDVAFDLSIILHFLPRVC